MKTLLTFSLFLFAIVAHAANPSTKSFRATGGLVVTSNDVTGVITYDGSLIVGSTNAPASSTSAGRGMSNLVWSAVLSVDSTNGTNATAIRGDISKPWRDVRTAMAASQSGDTIWVRSGIHDVGSNTLIVLPGRKLIGQGFGSIIRGLGSLDMDGPIVVPGSTSEVAHLTIEHGNLNDYKGATFGFQWVATNGPTFGPTNAVIHDVLMRGDTDCIYLRSTNYWDITAWNIHTLAAFDSLVQFSESSNGVSRWNNCFFKADLKGSVNDYSVTSGNASAVKIQGGVAEFIACSAIGTNGNLVTRGLVAVGGVTRWIGGSIEAAGTNDVLAASRETAATFIYSGNQLRVEDIGEGVTGSTIYGSQQTVISNITQVPGSSGLVIKTTDPFFTDYVFFSLAGGVNIGALTDPGAARLQVGSLPGSGDYVAADGNGLLFSTNAPAGSGGAFGADGLVQYANNGTNKAEAAFSYDEGDDTLSVTGLIAQVLQIYNSVTAKSLALHGGNVTISNAAPQVTKSSYSSTASLSGQSLDQRYRGTETSPTAIQEGDIIGSWQMLGYGDTVLRNAATLETSALGPFSDTSSAGLFVIKMGKTNSGTVKHTVFSATANDITNNANVTITSNLTVGIGSGVVNFSTNHTMEGVPTLTPSVDRTFTNASSGVMVRVLVDGITNQQVAVPLTAGQTIGHDGTTYVAVPAGSGGTNMIPLALSLSGTNVSMAGTLPAGTVGKILYTLFCSTNLLLQAPTGTVVPGTEVKLTLTQNTNGLDQVIFWDTGTGGFAFGTDLPQNTCYLATGSNVITKFTAEYDGTRAKWLVTGKIQGF